MALNREPRAAEWTLPTYQARSQEKRNQLLAAGLELVERVPFARLKISDIAKEAGCSVGTFYRRFPDKRSFLFALQEMANTEFLERLEAELPEARPANEIVLDAVGILVGDRRRRRGLATASLREATMNGGGWMPFHEAAIGFDRMLQRRLSCFLAGDDARRNAFEISFATQALYGILNHVTLIREGVILLDDDALIGNLARISVRYLGLADDANSAG